MQHTVLLHKILTEAHAIGHKKRLDSLLQAVHSVMAGAKLSLTSIGRHIDKPIKPRSKIQSINYLLSNGHLHNERIDIYAAINQYLCAGTQTLYVAVDWSTLVPHDLHLLRASLMIKGRAMVVYEEVHPQSQLGNSKVHLSFLKKLHKVLPDDKNVCLMTDAGFRTDFFRQVQDLGWDYVGRLLTNMLYTLSDENHWKPCADLYDQAKSTPEAIGAVVVSKRNPFYSNLYLYKKIKQPCLTKKKRYILYGKKEKNQTNSANKPWLIASSLKTPPENIMTIYRQRMKIEHDFRNLKNKTWGLGLRDSRTNDPMRLRLQLLIGMLATFALWFVGLCIEKQQLHYEFQANSIKNKRVLSLVFLGLEAIRSGYLKYLKPPNLHDLYEPLLDFDKPPNGQIL